MLYRAIVLTWAAGWTIDRLYEAGADDTVNLLGLHLATPQAGAVLAAVGCTSVSLAILVQVGGRGAHNCLPDFCKTSRLLLHQFCC